MKMLRKQEKRKISLAEMLQNHVQSMWIMWGLVKHSMSQNQCNNWTFFLASILKPLMVLIVGKRTSPHRHTCVFPPKEAARFSLYVTHATAKCSQSVCFISIPESTKHRFVSPDSVSSCFNNQKNNHLQLIRVTVITITLLRKYRNLTNCCKMLYFLWFKVKEHPPCFNICLYNQPNLKLQL